MVVVLFCVFGPFWLPGSYLLTLFDSIKVTVPLGTHSASTRAKTQEESNLQKAADALCFVFGSKN